jgi:putative DNA primase/helicase
LPGNDQLKGILNSGYKKKTGFVLRAANQPGTSEPSDASTPDTCHSSPPTGGVLRFSSWCPKAIATIGRLPDTLADRCIIIRMQRKTMHEECERMQNLVAEPLRRKCKRFVMDHEPEIAAAQPEPPEGLNDRATDIWEPLFALADLAGGDWPEKARSAALSLSATAQESNPISTLLLDMFFLFAITPEKRLFTRTLVEGLNTRFPDRPWSEGRNGKPITDQWLSQQLRPYGIKPKTIWIGDASAKGYVEEDLLDTFRRYISLSDYEAVRAEWQAAKRPASENAQNPAPAPAPAAGQTVTA